MQILDSGVFAQVKHHVCGVQDISSVRDLQHRASFFQSLDGLRMNEQITTAQEK